MFDIWDLIQHRQIQRAEENVELARKESDRVDERLHFESQRLEAKIDALALVCEAMWELVSERTALSRDDILSKMDEIDRRDGRADGKISGKPSRCTRCYRPVHTSQPKCMYCGAPVDGNPVVQSS